jgi:T5SS/PEP-CTERM-associated repeat protein
MIRAKGVTRAVVVATMVIAACAGAAEGATDLWIKSAGGTFTDPGNWSLTAPPAPADDAVFNLHSAGYTVTFGGTYSNAGLTVSDDAVTFDFKSYKYTLTRPPQSVTIGTAANDIGSLTLMNGTLASGDGRLGANVASTSGTVVVPGGAAWDSTGSLYIGLAGKGTVAVQSGGVMTANYVGVGYSPGSVGTLSVDGIGTIKAVKRLGEFADIEFAVEPPLLEQIVLKGSVAVDGVSLTVAGLDPQSFRVAAIPETLARTTLGSARTGPRVNIEIDILVKIVRRQLETMLPGQQPLTVDRLRQMGF